MTTARCSASSDAAAVGDRIYVPAAERNADAILRVLRDALPAGGTVLEIGSGSGQHVARFAAAMPEIAWQPSDPEPRHRTSIRAWCAEVGDHVAEPLDIDVEAPAWWQAVDGKVDAVLAINVLHCATTAAMGALLEGAGHLLTPGAPLLIYGPLAFNGVFGAPSNRNFDLMLRQQNQAWGVRDLNDVAALGARHGLRLQRVVEMPVNNHLVILPRT